MGGIRLEFELPAPPERVWPLLTDRNQLAVWFMETDFVPEPGQRFMIWPAQESGVDGPISAVVLTINEPSKLVMGWQSPNTQTTMTWTLVGTHHGTRLRVVEWGHVGAGEVAREQTLTRLFDVSLRALLERQAYVPASAGPSPNGAVPPAQAAASAFVPVVQPAPTTPPEGPPRPVGHEAPRSRRGRRILAAVIIALLALALLVVWLLWPPVPASDGRALPGVGGMGSSPAAGSTGGAPGGEGGSGGPGAVAGVGSGSGPGGTGPSVSTSGGPGAGPSASAPDDPGATVGPAPGTGPSAHLTVAAATHSSGLLGYNVTVTITNNATTVGQWTSAAAVLGAADLLVQPTDAQVIHTKQGTTHCFYPTAPVASVAGDNSYSFQFTITLAVGQVLTGTVVKSVTLDSMAC